MYCLEVARYLKYMNGLMFIINVGTSRRWNPAVLMKLNCSFRAKYNSRVSINLTHLNLSLSWKYQGRKMKNTNKIAINNTILSMCVWIVITVYDTPSCCCCTLSCGYNSAFTPMIWFQMFLQCLLTHVPLLFTRTLVDEWWPPKQCINLAVESFQVPGQRAVAP